MSNTVEKPKKNWNILVPYFFDDLSNFALQEGIALCKVFESGLVLLSCNNDENTKRKLAELSVHIETFHDIKTQSYATSENIKTFLFPLAHKTESILIVLGHNNIKTSLQFSLKKSVRFMRKSRTPFLMVPKGIHAKTFDNIAYCMGYQKNEKEKILWSSYFGRIYNSLINVVIPRASDQYFKTGIRANLQAMEKLYSNVDVKYNAVKIDYNIHKAQSHAIKYASEINAGAFLILTNLQLDIFDFFGGSEDVKAIRNSYLMPILCINPRDDLYVLCN